MISFRLTAEQLDLLKVIKGQAHTVDEKYKVLDARDKLSRYFKFIFALF